MHFVNIIEGKSPSRSEHLYGKTATIGTFFKGAMTILHKNIPYIVLKVLRYSKILKKVPKVAVLRYICSDL